MPKSQAPIRAFTIRVVFAVPSNNGTASVDLTCESHEEAHSILEQIETSLIEGTPIRIKHGTFHQILIAPHTVLYAQMELKQVRNFNEYEN